MKRRYYGPSMWGDAVDLFEQAERLQRQFFRLASGTARASWEPPADVAPSLPEDMLIILPVRNVVLFPGVIMPVAIKREKTVAGAQEAVQVDRQGRLPAAARPGRTTPASTTCTGVGTAANIVRYVTAPDGTHHLVCQGEQRFRVLAFRGRLAVPGGPRRVPERHRGGTPRVEARMTLHLKQKAMEAMRCCRRRRPNWPIRFQAIESPSHARRHDREFPGLKPSEKQELLETFDLRERLDTRDRAPHARVEVLKLSREIEQQTKERSTTASANSLLREQLRRSRRSSATRSGGEIAELGEAITKAGMPEEVGSRRARS
jgi:ATP-dependent Lon protease